MDTSRYGEPALSSAEIVVDEAEDEGRELLARLAERGAERGVEVTTRCRHGPPQDAAVEQVEAVDADFAVVGCTGNRHRTVKRLDGVVDEVVDATRRAAPAVGDRQ